MANAKEDDVKKLLEKVERVTKEKKLDLSSDEDLSIAIMNLIGIEEHLFFTAEKTGKDYYFDLLNEVREMRKELLKKIIKEYEGEVWCISKHLLSASMRLMEVGTKALTKGERAEAKDMFDKANNLYSLFWALNLNLVDSKSVKDMGIVSDKDISRIRGEERGKTTGAAVSATDVAIKENKGFFARMGEAVKKAIDCCKE